MSCAGVCICCSWGWPCLLSRADLKEHTKAWIKLSFKSTHSFMVQDSLSTRMDQLESGTLLQDLQDADVSTQGPQQQGDMEPARQPLRARSRLLKAPVTRQQLVELTFQQLFPHDVQAVIPAQEYKAVNELLREWNRKVQVYIHTGGLCELKKQRQQQKKKERKRQQAADDAAGVNGAHPLSRQVASTDQVHIKMAAVQKQAASASGAASPAAAGSNSGLLSSAVEGGSSSAQQSSSGSGSRSSAAVGGDSQPGSSGSPAAPQPPAGMVRPQGRHSRHSSTCSSDLDFSEGDEELGCCAATARRLWCCECCAVGSMQAGGHKDVEGGDRGAGGGRCSSSMCCGLFGCCQREQELPKASRDVLADKRLEILKLEGEIREEQAKVC